MDKQLINFTILLLYLFAGSYGSELTLNNDNTTQAGLVLRPAHLEGVPLERDGAVNAKYHQELLLGDGENKSPHDGQLHNAEDHENESLQQLAEQIRRMFKIADVDADGFLSREELRSQIENNTKHHLEEAERESHGVFQLVDEDGDGRITWPEYKGYLKTLEASTAAGSHLHEFHPRDLALEQKSAGEKTLFERADAESDGLDEMEWLGFRHPEQSAVLQQEMVDELLAAQDRNGDRRLTADEFAAPPQNAKRNFDVKGDELFRRHEFATLVDRDGDGYADVAELKHYVDPRNPQRHIDEADDLRVLFDADSDGRLSLAELLARAELLGASGFIHANLRLHDDL